ncbi:Protein ROOT PRIMORDIUM DEFECTIVE 1 [Raphanus sativus]|nr:Protein ROOT PRIMORDIUM DEFECTIVE 1 [Raphanus sativus]
MEVEKKIRKVVKFHSLILSQPQNTIPISLLDTLARPPRPRLQAARAWEPSSSSSLTSSSKALDQIRDEQEAVVSQIPEAVTRLRKLVMMSNTGRIRLEHVRIARSEFGLPDDFEYSVILKHPQFFRLSMERRLEISFKIGKYFRIAVWKWQRLPYWSPYEDISGYDLRSLEAQKRLEKRAVACIHELLSLTVEKKITLERIAHFRNVMCLPKRLKEFLLQHQGIFYISTRGNYGKLHTVFLREAYKRGELVEPNEVYLARRKLAELVLMSPRKAKVDAELVRYRNGFDDEMMMMMIANERLTHCSVLILNRRKMPNKIAYFSCKNILWELLFLISNIL